MVQNSMEMVEYVCLVSTWICVFFPFGRFHGFIVLRRRKETVGHVEGPSGNSIMVVPAPYEVPTENLNTSSKWQNIVFPARLVPCLPLVFKCVITLCVTIPCFFFIYFPLRFLVSCVVLVSQHKSNGQNLK
jgi:hypothetical protein